MILDLDVQLHYRVEEVTDVLLQLEAAATDDQTIIKANIQFSETAHFARIMAEDGIGERLWLRVEGDFTCSYTSKMRIERPDLEVGAMRQVSPHRLPGDTIKYLMPSRYCPSEEFYNFVEAEFGGLEGGARVAAMRDWIEDRFSYVSGASNALTTALDTFVQRQGVCRDFAHVLITLCRASTIPARFVSVFAPDVTPPDFHAVVEVYLDDDWHVIDPTGMAKASEMAMIGVGVDAAHVAFMTSYGAAELVNQTVSVASAG